jgi:hypothetical protein
LKNRIYCTDKGIVGWVVFGLMKLGSGMGSEITKSWKGSCILSVTSPELKNIFEKDNRKLIIS